MSIKSAAPSIDSLERASKKLSKEQNKQNLEKINWRIGENKLEKRSHEWVIYSKSKMLTIFLFSEIEAVCSRLDRLERALSRGYVGTRGDVFNSHTYEFFLCTFCQVSGVSNDQVFSTTIPTISSCHDSLT